MDRIEVRGYASRRAATARIALAALVASTLATLTPAIAASPSGASSGSVNVLYAGSLLDLMQTKLGPAFTRATGYAVSGFSDGSTALASEIKGGTQVGDVFISASPAVNASLSGKANGDWVSTYAVFGTSRLVLGYNRASRFATALTTQPWYRVVDRSGFLLGRTDPATDPKGVLAVQALRDAAQQFHQPELATLASSSSNVFPETTLVGRLQAGQLDAGFFYAVEAAAAHLPTVPLTGVDESAQYTVAILNRDPHGAAARAFVDFLLSASGRRILAANGITPVVPARFVAVAPGTTTTTS